MVNDLAKISSLDQGHRQLDPFVAHLNGVAWEADPTTWRFTWVSPAAEAILGYATEQWYTPNFWQEQLHPADRERTVAFCQQAIAEQRTHHCEYHMISASGQPVLLRHSAGVVIEAGAVTTVRGLLFAISETTQLANLQPAAEDAHAQQTHLWFLESLDKVNRAIQGASDLQQMMSDVLDTLLEIFGCDRAWLVYPCDPEAAMWHSPMERSRPEYPGVVPIGKELPIDPIGAELFRQVLAANGPVKFGPGAARAVPEHMTQMFDIQSMIMMALYPKVGKPWNFGFHQCASARLWTAQEERLFLEVGRRIGDALSTLLSHRTLQENEARYRTIFDLSNDYAYTNRVEVDGTIVAEWFTQGAHLITGYTSEETQAPGFWQKLVHPEDLPLLQQHVQKILAGQADTAEGRIITKTGEVRWLRDSAYPVWDASQGRVTNFFGGARDITAQKQMEVDLRASEARFRAIFEHAADAFFLHDIGGNVRDVNQQACASLGYTREELIGMNPVVFDADMRPELLQQMTERLLTGEIVAVDTRHRRKDGTIFPVELRVRPLLGIGEPRSLSLVRDITERKRTQEALSLFRTLMDHITDGIEIIDPVTERFLDVNEQACRMHGYTREEYLKFTVRDVIPADEPRPMLGNTADYASFQQVTFESRHRRKDGSIFPVEININLVHLDRVYQIALVRDITERKRTQEELTIFRLLMDHITDSIEIIDPETARFLDINVQACRTHGYTREEFLNLTVSDIVPQDAPRILLNDLAEYAHLSQTIFESQHRRKDGSLFPVEVNLNSVQLDRGYQIAVVRDITQRKHTEQALAESSNLLNAVFEGASDAIYVKDRQGRYVMVNSAGARCLGRTVDEVIGQEDSAFFPPEVAQAIAEQDRQVILSSEPLIFELTWAVGGVARIFLVTKSNYRDAQGQISGIVAIMHDITEFKRLEEQFRQAQKMEAVGQLAGGVAHDFNNLLTVINGYSGLLFNRLPVDDPNRKRLGEIRKAGERAADLTRQLLAFSRKQVLQPKLVHLNTLLRDLLQMLRRLISEDIELTLASRATLDLVRVDPGQFEQAIVNLAVNARDAMPHGGRLEIHTEDAEFDNSTAHYYPEVKSGRYVMVTISDSGVGIDEAIKARIFEPFFTTKEPGKGTGLGLAMVYGFVKQSDGHIEVESMPGQGTSFKIYLPQAEDGQVVTKPAIEETSVISGSETILLVEDEEAVRQLFAQALRSTGYTVLEASNGLEAEEIAQNHPDPIQLLVTDLVMPRLNGRQLAERLTQVRPHLRVIFISGYTDEAVLRHGVIEGSMVLLQKPFGPTDLLHKIREVLHPE